MANRKSLTALAKQVGKEMAATRPGNSLMQAQHVLEAEPAAVLDILDLLMAEGSKKRPNADLISAYMLMFGQGLEQLRYRVEAGHHDAEGLLDMVRSRLLTRAQGGEVNRETLLLILSEFETAKVDPGDDLRTLMADQFTGDAEPLPDDDGLQMLREFIGTAAKGAKGDPFALHGQMAEVGAAFPEDHRYAMATFLLRSGEPTAREAALGWLLDPSPQVRERLASDLTEAVAHDAMTPTMLRRMIALRNWLPDTNGARAALDRAIQASRRQGVECAPWPDAQVRELIATGTDGSGAIGIAAFCKEGRKHAMATALLKYGIGIRDSWVQHGMTRAETDAIQLRMETDVDQIDLNTEFLKAAIPHFLAVGNESGTLPPFGLLAFLETVGLHSIQPELMSNEALLARMEEQLEPEERNSESLELLLEQSHDLPELYPFLESWFEDGDDVQALLRRNRQSAAKREALVLEKLLEPRRARWADLLTWTAFLLSHGDEEVDWPEFYASARAIVDGRPLAEIPIMRYVGAWTVEVQRRNAMLR